MKNSLKNNLSEEDQYFLNGIHVGDKAVFDKMFVNYYSGLCNFVSRIIKADDVYEDLVQDLFVKIWLGRKKWEPHTSIKSYLYKAARNQAINYLKRYDVVNFSSGEELEDEISDNINLEEELYHKDLSEAVQNAINSLPDRCRLVFTMHRQEGLKYSEIADILNISINAVEKQMGRAFRIMRKLLTNFLPALGLLGYIKHLVKF